ncbi:bifunctional alpha,alpha-trehalose-phosphate synthase (UDP-forming)/trehalose-phosphatase [Mucilaginibacter paludis]|uniref:Alpha,alpha-trehalose-phosphate synthase n=1 Tax=Mucilaginibacter paludis DSM 18603 TaxID=714943 RepID=H1YDR2_9SPHI|nr:bifunctional alpha,alpha-trehalose-phosphate synthase (UDP-forming)/trehalose-phosphatase [Mucilaginibacter paludis]EHQ30751.1 trehalose-phosphatase [Mucilaginibacter paludis DSM 18603]
MSKTIIISNRLPVKILEQNGEYTLEATEGGLATGLGSIYKQGNNIWIGWPGLEMPEDKQDDISKKLHDMSLFPVYLSQEEINEYYEGFSNEVLWPVFHYYASTYANYKQSNWQYYQQVNKKFCEVVLSIVEPGDTIWVHDYQLLLLPGLIRNAQPELSIGFFLHIPFPSYEMFRLIPWRAELLEGMLGADLIGFHTFDDARHFLSATGRILPVRASSNIVSINDRSVVVESFPMGIDHDKYASLTKDDKVKEQIKLLKANFKGIRIILSVDRLDYSKGILQRLQAFEMLLKTYPDYKEKVSLYMIVVPSRDTVPQYKELRDQIDKKVGNINALYRTMDWSPIHYYYRSFPLETLSALYHIADVGLVTPMRDGMNLVSKEYVASRTKNDGVLILSEMAGASKELIDAIIVNPNNTLEVCGAIVEALNMDDDEKKRRMSSMRKVVEKFNIGHWVKLFMNKLTEVKTLQQSMRTKHVSYKTEQHLKGWYAHAEKRIIFLDYDGTLVNFNTNINHASPDEDLYSLLDKLSSDPLNHIVLISGRKHENLSDWFGHMDIDLVAEHGAWTKAAGQKWHRIPGLTDQWKPEILQVLENYVDRTPGSFVEEKTYSLVWHYRKVEESLGDLRSNELMNNLKYLVVDKGLQILPGDKVVEIKNMEINKGRAALTLIDNKEYDFIMALGDDYTDEDIFKALPDTAITIKIGNNSSAAKYYLRNPQEVRKLLRVLTHLPQLT